MTARGLAIVVEHQRRFREALQVRRDELVRTAKVRGVHDVFVATGLAGLGQHGLDSGRLALAEQYFLNRRSPPGAGSTRSDHWRIDEARGLLGLARLRAGRHDAGETDLQAAYEGLRAIAARRRGNAGRSRPAGRVL